MGTELQRRGVETRLPLWSSWALIEAPETVQAIHREYLEAGADVITTNTFRTHRRSLAEEGMGGRAKELARIAVEPRVRERKRPSRLWWPVPSHLSRIATIRKGFHRGID